MRSAQRIGLLAILLAAISTRLLASSAPLRINESEMSAVISEREIALIAHVSNESETAVSGNLYVDLLDPKDAVVASSKTTERLKPGRSLIKLSLPRPAIPVVADNDPVLWYRVKYRLLLDDKRAASGVVALGAIAPDMFELRIAHADKALPDLSRAERIRSRGWGMMIAEIGLPPGSDVDRRVLDEAVSNSGWTVSHYDVLPDRLVLYLWPNAGGAKLTFAFHPRYGLKARTAPSVLYDYYQPEALVALPPADFNIKAIPQSEPVKTVAGK